MAHISSSVQRPSAPKFTAAYLTARTKSTDGPTVCSAVCFASRPVAPCLMRVLLYQPAQKKHTNHLPSLPSDNTHNRREGNNSTRIIKITFVYSRCQRFQIGKNQPRALGGRCSVRQRCSHAFSPCDPKVAQKRNKKSRVGTKHVGLVHRSSIQKTLETPVS